LICECIAANIDCPLEVEIINKKMNLIHFFSGVFNFCQNKLKCFGAEKYLHLILLLIGKAGTPLVDRVIGHTS
jgi:hypothetical protein